MTTSQPRERYHWSLIVLHWLVAALVIVQYVTSGAVLRIHQPLHQPRFIGARPDPFDVLLHTIHIRTGLLIVALMVLRLGLRWRFGVPQPLGDAASWRPKIAKALHLAFYAITIVQVATGAIAYYFWWPMSAVHIVLFKILLSLIALHVAAALWHQFFVRDGALRRIVGA